MNQENKKLEGSPRGGNRRGGRFSARRKFEAVQRLNRGESLESLSRELGVTAATLSEWQVKSKKAAENALKSRDREEQAEETERLKAKIGELTMANELLYEKIHRLEETHPFPWRRSSR